MPTTLITDSTHYTTVLDLASKAKHTLWIDTASGGGVLRSDSRIVACFLVFFCGCLAKK